MEKNLIRFWALAANSLTALGIMGLLTSLGIDYKLGSGKFVVLLALTSVAAWLLGIVLGVAFSWVRRSSAMPPTESEGLAYAKSQRLLWSGYICAIVPIILYFSISGAKTAELLGVISAICWLLGLGLVASSQFVRWKLYFNR